MLYYAIGPCVAFLISMKFTDMSTKKRSSEIKILETRIEQLEKDVDAKHEELAQKVLGTIVPVARVVDQLQTTIGVQ